MSRLLRFFISRLFRSHDFHPCTLVPRFPFSPFPFSPFQRPQPWRYLRFHSWKHPGQCSRFSDVQLFRAATTVYPRWRSDICACCFVPIWLCVHTYRRRPFFHWHGWCVSEDVFIRRVRVCRWRKQHASCALHVVALWFQFMRRGPSTDSQTWPPRHQGTNSTSSLLVALTKYLVQSELVLHPPADVTQLVRCYDETLTTLLDKFAPLRKVLDRRHYGLIQTADARRQKQGSWRKCTAKSHPMSPD